MARIKSFKKVIMHLCVYALLIIGGLVTGALLQPVEANVQPNCQFGDCVLNTGTYADGACEVNANATYCVGGYPCTDTNPCY
ncbi:MAG TPA: hypothetical protein VJ991_11245 [Balneolales bacterium]|nr:hypothetical protein [Balneolales bacterium]HYX09333.1 hypothetical protein [Bacteroidales bacterium]